MTVSQTPRVLATQMVTATDGWQASSGRLGDYALSRTTDGGVHWQQVSPTGIWDHLAGPAAFLDAIHAWAALVLDDAPAPSQTARSVVFRTDDGGATWHCGEPFVPGGGIEQIIFTDSLHGQMRVRQHGTTSAEVIAMFITDDAGTHWRMQ